MHDYFEYYPVSADSVRSAAQDTRSRGDAVHNLLSQVETTHQGAVQAVEGAMRYTVISSPEGAQQAAQDVGRKTAWASCQLEEFADAIQTFDYDSTTPPSVSKLNALYAGGVASNFGVSPVDYPPDATPEQRATADDQHTDDIAAARAALINDLQAKYAQLELNLDNAATRVSGNLGRDPSDAEIRAAWKAGNLPATAMLLWPALHLAPTEITGLPPELATLTGEDLKNFLAAHPEFAVFTNRLLQRDGQLTAQEQAVVNAQAQVDAETLKQGLATQPPGKAGLDQLKAAQERLALINQQVASGQRLTDAQRQYLTTYLNGVGAEDLARLPGYVEEAFSNEVPSGVGGYVYEAMYKDYMAQYVAPTANAIMNVSNDKVGGYATVGEMPEAVRALLDIRIGVSYNGMRFGDVTDDDPTFDSIRNLDTFNGFAALMSASTVAGGTDFTKELGETALQAKQDLNAMLSKLGRDTNWGFFDGETFNALHTQLNDGGVSDLMSVVGRDSAASAALLTASPENLQRVLGLNWDDGQGAADIINAATDRDPSDGQGGTVENANAALAILVEVARDPSEYQYRVGNELVSDAIVDTGIKWIDTFGNDVNLNQPPGVVSNAKDLLGRDLGFALTLSPEDRSQFLQYVASTGDQDAVRLQTAAQVYGANLIGDALKTDDPVTVNQTMAWAGRADGTITQANFEWAIDQAENKDDAAMAAHLAETRRNAALNTGIGIVKSLGTTAAGVAFPPSAPFLAVGDAFASPLIDNALGHGPAPDSTAGQTREGFYNPDQIASSQTRNYQLLMAIDASGGATDPQYAGLYNADGTLKNVNELDPTLVDRLVQERMYQWQADHAAPLPSVSEYDTARDNIMNGSHADNDRIATSGWRDDVDARQLLYGDNAVDFEGDWRNGSQDDWDNSSRTLYSPDSEKVGDNVWNFQEDDEAAQIRDARGDIRQLEDDLATAEAQYGADSDQADDIRDDLEDRREDLEDLVG